MLDEAVRCGVLRFGSAPCEWTAPRQTAAAWISDPASQLDTAGVPFPVTVTVTVTQIHITPRSTPGGAVLGLPVRFSRLLAETVSH